MKKWKRILSVVMTICMVFSLLPSMNGASIIKAYAGQSDEDKAVVAASGYTYDVYLNKDSSLPYDVNALAKKVEKELDTLIGESDETYSIKTSTHSIDTTDLSGWYVYDHYDTAHYANQAAWEAVYGESSYKRPYQPYSETNNYYESDIVKTLEEMSKTDLTQFTYVKKLDQHIYSYTDESNGMPAMLFAGYGAPEYTDFLFYPTTNTGKKKVNYSVNSKYVNVHTLLGSGFLFNTGIDENGYIHGYVLYYKFPYDFSTSSPKISGIYIYKIKDNVLASSFAQGALYNTSSFLDMVAYTSTAPSWGTLMDIQLTITPQSILVQQRTGVESGENNAEYTDIPFTMSSDSTIKTEVPLDSMETYGFGPIVQYDSHGCEENSLFLYSNLAMSFENEVSDQSSLLSTLKTVEYEAESNNKVFVNLTGDEYASAASATEDDKGLVGIMKNSKIMLITNYNSATVGATGDTNDVVAYPSWYMGTNVVDINSLTGGTNELGNGATTVAGKVKLDDNTATPLSIDDLAKNIAAAIYHRTYDSGQGHDLDGNSETVSSAASLVLRDSAVNGKDVQCIRTSYLSEEGIKIYLDTSSSIVSGEVDPEFTISVNGESETLEYQTEELNDATYRYFVVKNNEDWPSASYVITVNYGNDLSAQRTLKIGYGVFYDVNGTYIPALSQTKIKNEDLKLVNASDIDSYAPEGTTFGYWQSKEGNEKYKSGQSYSKNEDVEFDAMWILPAPENVKLEIDESKVATVTWDEISVASGYQVDYYVDGELVQSKDITEGTTTSDTFDMSNVFTADKMSAVEVYVTGKHTNAYVVPQTSKKSSDTKVRYPVPKTVPGGNLTSPYTQGALGSTTPGEIAYAFAGYATVSQEDGIYTITLNENVQVESTVVFPADVILDLNGYAIVGPDGEDGSDGTAGTAGAAGGDGGAAVLARAGTLTIKNGLLVGGNGGDGGAGSTNGEETPTVGNGGNGGNGGEAIGAEYYSNSTIVLSNVSMTGGDMGYGGAAGTDVNAEEEAADGTEGTPGVSISNYAYNVTIEEGTYTLKNDDTYGFICRGTFTQNGGVVNLSEDTSYGLYANNIVLNGGECTLNKGNNYGLYADNQVTLDGGAILKISDVTTGIYGAYGVVIKDAHVNMSGSMQYGIRTYRDVEVYQDADVDINIKVDDANSYIFGIYASNNVKISDGTLDIAVESLNESYALYGNYGITMDRGDISLSAKNGDSAGYALYSYYPITVPKGSDVVNGTPSFSTGDVCYVKQVDSTKPATMKFHTFDNASPVVEWAIDYSSATLSFDCDDYENCQYTEVLKVTPVVNTTQTCTESGTITYVANFHFDYNDKDYQYKVTVATDEPLGHDLTYHAEEENTCTQDGHHAYYQCERCGKLYSDSGAEEEITLEDAVIEATHTLERLNAKAATCAQQGNIACWHCTVCDKYFVDKQCKIELDEEDVYTTIEHDYATVVDAVEATCTQQGNIAYTYCKNCGELFAAHKQQDATYIYEMLEEDADIAIAPLGHAYTVENRSNDTLVAAATCTTKAKYHYTCSECGDIASDDTHTFEYGSPLGHSFTHHAKVEATCTTNGSKEYYECSTCHKKYADNEPYSTNVITDEEIIIPATGHHFTEKNETATYLVSGATCEEAAVYRYSCKCGLASDATFKSELSPKLYHKYNVGFEWNSDNTLCTATFTCSRCQEKHVYTCGVGEEGYSKTPKTTCTDPGTIYTAVFKPDLEDVEESEIGKQFTAKNIDAGNVTGHSFTNYVSNNDATCEKDGTKTAYCDYECGESHTIDDEGTALGHHYANPEFVWANDASDCTATFTCEHDSNHTLVKTKENGVTITSEIVTQPTCLENGTTKYTATVIVDGKTYTSTKQLNDIAKTGHACAHEDAVPATCESTGRIEYWHCVKCGNYYKTDNIYDENSITKSETVVPALGHNYILKNKAGKTGFDWLLDENHVWIATATFECANNPAHLDVREVSVTSRITRKPTCTEDGEIVYTGIVTFMGQKYTDNYLDTVSATGHQWDEGTVTKEATCTQKGEITYTCTADGCEETRTEEIPSLGEHQWDEGTETKEATCTQKGEIVYTCTVDGCDATKTEEVEALGHEWEEEYTIDEEATCEEAGSKSIHCERCDATKNTTKINALGHLFTKYVNDNNATIFADGTKTAECERGCGATDVQVIKGSSAKATTISKEQQTENEFAINAGLKVSQTGSKISVKWGKVSKATGYKVYITYCGKKFATPITVKGEKSTSVSITKISGKALNLKKNFKVYVAAYKTANGKDVVLAKTITAHIVGKKNTKYTNPKSLKVSKTSYTLSKGGKAQIKAKTVLVDPKKKSLTDAHAKEFRYLSTNKKVATVSSTGAIKAVGKGTCTIYVYARNGYAKKIKVKVK